MGEKTNNLKIRKTETENWPPPNPILKFQQPTEKKKPPWEGGSVQSTTPAPSCGQSLHEPMGRHGCFSSFLGGYPCVPVWRNDDTWLPCITLDGSRGQKEHNVRCHRDRQTAFSFTAVQIVSRWNSRHKCRIRFCRCIFWRIFKNILEPLSVYFNCLGFASLSSSCAKFPSFECFRSI